MVKLDPKLVSMARGMARAFARRCPRSVLPEDLEQAAMLGLLDGLQRHPDGSGPGWEFYLRCRIKGAIIDDLRTQDWAGRRRGGRARFQMKHLEDVNQLWQELVPGGGESPEETAMRQHDAAKAWSTPMCERDQRIMRQCYARGVKHRDIGTVEGISEPRVTQLVLRSLATMRSHLTGELPGHGVPRWARAGLWQKGPEAGTQQGASAPARPAPGEKSVA